MQWSVICKCYLAKRLRSARTIRSPKGAFIGVRKSIPTGSTTADITGANGSDISKYFSSDNSAYSIQNKSDDNCIGFNLQVAVIAYRAHFFFHCDPLPAMVSYHIFSRNSCIISSPGPAAERADAHLLFRVATSLTCIFLCNAYNIYVIVK